MLFKLFTFFILFNVSTFACRSREKTSEAACSKYNNETSLKNKELSKCILSLPGVELEDSSKDFLNDHKVYVSLTSSPERLHYISEILSTIPVDLVDKIFIALPEKFKNKEEYPEPLPVEITQRPMVEILRPSFDYGPVMKMLPAIEYVQKIDPESIVISIDDDTIYPPSLFYELVNYLTTHRDVQVAGTVGQAKSFWNLKPKNITFKNTCLFQGVCDVVEGFGAIAYTAGAVPVDDLKVFSQKSSSCKLGDDIFINYALELHNITRHKVSEKSSKNLVQLYYGFGADALHQQVEYKNSYQQCIESIEE